METWLVWEGSQANEDGVHGSRRANGAGEGGGGGSGARRRRVGPPPPLPSSPHHLPNTHGLHPPPHSSQILLPRLSPPSPPLLSLRVARSSVVVAGSRLLVLFGGYEPLDRNCSQCIPYQTLPVLTYLFDLQTLIHGFSLSLSHVPPLHPFLSFGNKKKTPSISLILRTVLSPVRPPQNLPSQ
ncbi:hypothetical protein BDY24DRAFT_440129, partial [Mrakia frigida]|uniref:uncharacterized protein n=1 Tax=Mrakia frigida TaxID=29902 RepID=UPI003FCBFB93